MLKKHKTNKIKITKKTKKPKIFLIQKNIKKTDKPFKINVNIQNEAK